MDPSDVSSDITAGSELASALSGLNETLQDISRLEGESCGDFSIPGGVPPLVFRNLIWSAEDVVRPLTSSEHQYSAEDLAELERRLMEAKEKTSAVRPLTFVTATSSCIVKHNADRFLDLSKHSLAEAKKYFEHKNVSQMLGLLDSIHTQIESIGGIISSASYDLDSLHAKRQVLLERKEALDFYEPFRLLRLDEASPLLKSLAQSEGYKALQAEVKSVYSGHASALNDLDEHPPASARQSVEDLFRLTNRPFKRLSTDGFKKVSDVFTRVTSAIQDHLTKNDTQDTRDLVSSYVTRATKKLQQLTKLREEWEALEAGPLDSDVV